jgi:hypothetical protein
MSTLSPFYPGLRVRIRRPLTDVFGGVIPAGSRGILRGLDRAGRPQIEFDGRPGRFVSVEERDLEPIGA